MQKTLGMLLDEAEIKIESYISEIMKAYNIPPSIMEYLVSHALNNVRETKYKEYITEIAKAEAQKKAKEENESEVGE